MGLYGSTHKRFLFLRAVETKHPVDAFIDGRLLLKTLFIHE